MCVEERYAAEEKVYCCRKLFMKKDIPEESSFQKGCTLQKQLASRKQTKIYILPALRQLRR